MGGLTSVRLQVGVRVVMRGNGEAGFCPGVVVRWSVHRLSSRWSWIQSSRTLYEQLPVSCHTCQVKPVTSYREFYFCCMFNTCTVAHMYMYVCVDQSNSLSRTTYNVDVASIPGLPCLNA